MIVYIYFRFQCNICDKKHKCSHMAKRDVVIYCESKSHLDQAILLKSQPKLSFVGDSEEATKRTEVELQIAVLTAASNVPLAVHDQLSPMIGKAFPDSKIASKYHFASTKATCMLNEAVRVYRYVNRYWYRYRFQKHQNRFLLSFIGRFKIDRKFYLTVIIMKLPRGCAISKWLQREVVCGDISPFLSLMKAKLCAMNVVKK